MRLSLEKQLRLVFKMSKRGEEVNWSKIPNASPKPKRLHLEEDVCESFLLFFIYREFFPLRVSDICLC